MVRDGGDPLAPQGLDIALDWLERSLDQLTDAARRTAPHVSSARQAPDAAAPVSAPASGAASTSRATQTADVQPSSVADRPSRTTPAPGVRPSSGAGPSSQATPAPDVPLSSGSASGPDLDAPGSQAPDAATPLLDSVGRDLTALARNRELAPVIGREDEIASVVETLVRTRKRNPILLGPAGAGKTSIVEGLAERIATGDVPGPLRDVRIIEIPLASLVAGTSYRGQLEERLGQLVREASRPEIVLFFDEVHLLAGAGRSEGGMGADQVIKPALARGDIAVIGATTPDEYRDSIEKDEALARRFATIEVHELTKDETRPVLRSVRDALAERRGVRATDEALEVLLDFAERRIANRRFPDKAIDLLEEAVAQAIVAGTSMVGPDDAVRTTERWERRVSSTPTLDRFGRDLVALAHEGALTPIVGRDAEIDAVAEVLLRRTKRNPLLLGPAGSGKTAIVEGLAERVASGSVPEGLHEIRVFDVPLTGLAGAIEREPERLRDLLAEARHPSVVVFFDEIHVLASPAARQLAESLKPALARGEIACIGATTGEEYQAAIEPEAALARRFTPIYVQPMDAAAVESVLRGVRDGLARLRGVTVTDEALGALRDIATVYLPNRSFPDKGVDLVEQAVAYAVVRGRTEVDVPLAREAAAAYLGFPLDPGPALAALSTAIATRALLRPDDAAALVRRLGVTMRGLDASARRPDAVVLLAGAASDAADLLSAALAQNLFGRDTARITIDLSGMTDESSISTLLGSAPGLVGSDRPLPLQELRRAPRQVVTLEGIERCAASIRSTVSAALTSGSFTDAMGRPMPLGSAIVVLTAPSLSVPEGIGGEATSGGEATGTDGATGAEGAVGDGAVGSAAPPADQVRALLGAELGPELLAACDVVAWTRPGDAAQGERAPWIRNELLAPLDGRFGRIGLQVTFDDAFVDWLARSLATVTGSPDAFLDGTVTPALLGSVSSGATGRFIATADAAGPRLAAAGTPATLVGEAASASDPGGAERRPVSPDGASAGG